MDKKKNILIVEDEPVNRQILSKILSQDYNITQASNGAEACGILIAKKDELDAVVTDLYMPVMDGFELISFIQDQDMQELPIIAITGEANNVIEQKVLDAGAWDFVSKPYSPKVLLSRLRNALDRRQQVAYEMVKRMVEYDSLTNLYNRSKMFEATREMIDEHEKTKFLFVRIDMDNFALFNSAFGEEEGDKLLCFLAEKLKEVCSRYKYSTLGRINADIFCMCIPYLGDNSIIERGVEEIQEKLAGFRRNYLLEISAGIYIVEDRDAPIETMYIRASMGARNCKRLYGKHLGFFSKALEEKAAEEIGIAGEMEDALANGEFVVYFQPKVNLMESKLSGAEALVRWNHPKKGLILPGKFIPVFEKNGFIAKMDYYVFEETCKIIKEWERKNLPLKPVSVNISRISMYNPNLTKDLNALISKYQILKNLFQLEVTESAYMSNPDLMKNTISQLRNSGFTVLMDDFGSGYSSLNTLKEIDVDVLKIDMKFLPVNETIEKAEIILASIIKMATWLGMSVIVEGVETREQKEFLEGTGCDAVQGYFYARPMPEEDYVKNCLVNYEKGFDNDKARNVDTVYEKKASILVVCDDEEKAILLEEAVSDLYSVKISRSAEEGFVYAKNNKNSIQLILVEGEMKSMSGLDFTLYVQDEPGMRLIPIIVIGDENSQMEITAFKNGAFDYISRPFTKELLRIRVKHAIKVIGQYRILDDLKNDYKNMAERDYATGLMNRRTFVALGERYLSSEDIGKCALMVIDIDDFKNINDSYGHLLGDRVLKVIADILKNEFRKVDLIGRFGGDEFMVLMSNVSEAEIARKKALDLIEMVPKKFHSEESLKAGISIGIAFSKEEDSVESLFKRADAALYKAKKAGKNQVAFDLENEGN